MRQRSSADNITDWESHPAWCCITLLFNHSFGSLWSHRARVQPPLVISVSEPVKREQAGMFGIKGLCVCLFTCVCLCMCVCCLHTAHCSLVVVLVGHLQGPCCYTASDVPKMCHSDVIWLLHCSDVWCAQAVSPWCDLMIALQWCVMCLKCVTVMWFNYCVTVMCPSCVTVIWFNYCVTVMCLNCVTVVWFDYCVAVMCPSCVTVMWFDHCITVMCPSCVTVMWFDYCIAVMCPSCVTVMWFDYCIAVMFDVPKLRLCDVIWLLRCSDVWCA